MDAAATIVTLACLFNAYAGVMARLKRPAPPKEKAAKE